MRQIVDHRTIRCELMAMKQKNLEFVVRNGEPGKFFRRKRRALLFFRWYPDEIAGLTARQSGSNIDASETPRLRLFESLILVNREPLVQARLLPAILSVVHYRWPWCRCSRGRMAILRCPLAGLLALFPALLSLLLSLCHRVSQASYHSTSSSPSARCPSSGVDVDNEEADARENVVVTDRHADVRASAAMTD